MKGAPAAMTAKSTPTGGVKRFETMVTKIHEK